MSKSDGITRSRWKKESYKGFSIIQVTAVHHWYNNYSHCYEMSRAYETKRESYYEFCKAGDENSPSKAYTPYPYVKTIEDIQKCIDNFIKDDTLYFTDAEREKYVRKPNSKCHWAYGYDSLMKLLKEHKKADKRMKWFLEERLHDANFHTAANYLSDCDYDGFEQFVAKDCQFHEKFEVYTHTMRKAIEDPKKLEDGLNKVISDYLASQGIKDTSVEVRLCEEW